MTRRITFATAPAHQRDMETWPTCDMSQLSAVQAGHIERRAKALKAYLINGKLKPAAALGGCSGSVLLNSLTRCLTIAADGRIFGLRALLPRGRIKEYARTKALPKGSQRASLGASGSFAALLNQHSDIRAHLDACIERGGSRHLTSSKPRAIDVYRTFIQFCRTRVGPDCYPFNSSSSARRSVERYVRSYLEQNTSCVKTWSGQDAAQRLRLGTGHRSFVLGEVPFDEVAFDAHQIHCIGIVEVPGPVGPQRIPKLAVGPMVTGSSVVASLDIQNVFRQQHRKMIGVDMECYGLYYACASNAGPSTKVLCIKSVSDLADREKGDSFQKYCSYMSAMTALDVVSRYLVG